MPVRNRHGPDAPHNLPSRLTSFVGRERDLAELERLASTCRLLTLTGPGGSGKTRLALELAARLESTYTHGVYVVSLAPIADPAFVVAAIAQVLGVRDAPGRPLLGGIVDYVRGRHLLLLLDNFEHVLDAATAVDDLLRACPGLRVLVTSRAALQFGGEHTFPVPPLGLPDSTHTLTPETISQYGAVALFVERAVANKPDFTVTTVNAPAVAGICARLDGLPLAIELAAARIRVLSPEAMLPRLGHGLALLTGGRRDLPARQQTLRSAIAWSYDLLSEAEQRLFRRLSVFSGGFTLEAAEAIGGDTAIELDVLDGVGSLVEKSLVRSLDVAGREPRFTMLETIREYALEQLVARNEADDLRRQHAEYFLTLAEQAEARLSLVDAGHWLDKLQADHDNLRAALAWSEQTGSTPGLFGRLAGALWRFWWMRGYLSEGRRWLDRALARTTDPTVRSLLLRGAADLAFFQDSYPRARELWTQFIELGRSTGRPADAAFGLARLAHVVRNTGDVEQAVTLSEESVTLSRQIGDARAIAHSLHNRATVARSRGDLDRAQADWEEALGLFREVGSIIMVPHVVNNLGNVARMRGELDKASTLCEEALELFRQRDDLHGLQACLLNLLRIAHLQGYRARVRSLGRELLPISRDQGSLGWTAEALETLACSIRVGGDPMPAARLLAAAEMIRETAGKRIIAPDREWLEGEVAELRTTLGEEAFAAAWAEGRAMALDQAIDYALGLDEDAIAAPVAASVPPEPVASASVRALAALTPREHEVAILVARGCTNRRIAEALILSERTVDSHVRNIMGKLEINSRAQIAAWVVQHDRGDLR